MTRGQTITAALDMKQTDLAARGREALAAMPPPLAGEDEVVARLREKLRDALSELDRIASGNVRRNDATVLKAVEMLLRYTQPLPKQTIEHQGAVGIAVIDPFAVAPAAGEPTAPAAPRATPPTIRRAARATVETVAFIVENPPPPEVA